MRSSPFGGGVGGGRVDDLVGGAICVWSAAVVSEVRVGCSSWVSGADASVGGGVHVLGDRDRGRRDRCRQLAALQAELAGGGGRCRVGGRVPASQRLGDGPG